MTMSPSGVAPNVPAVAPFADLVGECRSLGVVAPHDADGVAVLRRPGADGGGHVARADDADGGHDVCSLGVYGSAGRGGLAACWAQITVVPPSATSSMPLT